MLEVQRVTKKFSFYPAVDNVSFTLRPSEILGYLGPNGAGKTTTIKMLAGLLQPSQGRILFQGKDIREDLFAFKSRIGYVPEQSEIYSHLSAFEYLLLVGRLHSIPDKVLREKIGRFMDLFHLSNEMDAEISSFSKGMVQKVLITAALLHDPDILLLDEPLSGLDVATGLVIKNLMQKLATEGKLVIYCSHVLEVVEKVCHRVLIIHKGRILADDSVDNLRSLMKLPSLEDIFSQLVIQEDTDRTAVGIVEAMKSHG